MRTAPAHRLQHVERTKLVVAAHSGQAPPGRHSATGGSQDEGAGAGSQSRHASHELGRGRPAAIPAAIVQPAPRQHGLLGYRQPVPHGALHPDGGRRPGAPRRLRQYRQPAAGPRRRPPAGGLHPHGYRRGLLFAVWGSRLLVRFLSKAGSELQLDTAPDLRVLAFTMGVAVLTGLLFGLAPALRATSVSPNNVLKEHARGMVGSRFNLGRALVTGQVALSLMLLVGAGLFLGTLRNLLSIDLGFSRHNILLVRAGLMQTNVPKAQRPRVYREIVGRLRAIPGVSSVSSSVLTPIGNDEWDRVVDPEGYSPRGKYDTQVYFNRVSPGYFETMRTPFLLGRDFSEHDDTGAPKVMLIGESAARRFFGQANPIDRTIRVNAEDSHGKKDVYQVIGVGKDRS